MAEKNKGKEPPVFLSTHPSSQKRITNLENYKGKEENKKETINFKEV